ncbi:hypothetical protein ACFTE1_11160 [Salininema proteolyticum]
MTRTIARLLQAATAVALFLLGFALPLPSSDPADRFPRIDGYDESLALIDLFAGGGLSALSVFGIGIIPLLLARELIDNAAEFARRPARLRKHEPRAFQRLINGTGLAVAVPLNLWIAAAHPASDEAEGLLLLWGVLMAGSGVAILLSSWIDRTGLTQGATLLAVVQVGAGLFAAAPSDLVEVIVPLTLTVVAVLAVVLLSQAVRNVPIQYAKRMVGRREMRGTSTHLPIPLIVDAVFPMARTTFCALFLIVVAVRPWAEVSTGFQAGFSTVVFLLGVIGTTLLVREHSGPLADRIKQAGGFIPGIRPGQPTAHYLRLTQSRVAAGGTGLLLAVLAVPLIGSALWGPGIATGISLLLVVHGGAQVGLAVARSRAAELAKDRFAGALRLSADRARALAAGRNRIVGCRRFACRIAGPHENRAVGYGAHPALPQRRALRSRLPPHRSDHMIKGPYEIFFANVCRFKEVRPPLPEDVSMIIPEYERNDEHGFNQVRKTVRDGLAPEGLHDVALAAPRLVFWRMAMDLAIAGPPIPEDFGRRLWNRALEEGPPDMAFRDVAQLVENDHRRAYERAFRHAGLPYDEIIPALESPDARLREAAVSVFAVMHPRYGGDIEEWFHHTANRVCPVTGALNDIAEHLVRDRGSDLKPEIRLHLAVRDDDIGALRGIPDFERLYRSEHRRASPDRQLELEAFLQRHRIQKVLIAIRAEAVRKQRGRSGGAPARPRPRNLQAAEHDRTSLRSAQVFPGRCCEARQAGGPLPGRTPSCPNPGPEAHFEQTP